MTSIDLGSATKMRRPRHRARYFFVALGLFAVVVALVAFVPEYLRMARGSFPIAGVLHIHGALMAAWLGSFVIQAALASTGRIARHRKIGPYGFALGIAVWASMVFVEARALVAHPLPTDGPGYDELLQGPCTFLTFLVLLLWAFRERRRPEWHKRLMTIATFVALLAPIERIEWLPELGVGYIWASMLWMDLCIIAPLLAYDLIAAKRIHPATKFGVSVMLGAQTVVFLLWGTSAWRHFAFVAAHAIRAVF